MPKKINSKRKFKKVLALAISLIALGLFCLGLFIANFFYPIKYFPVLFTITDNKVNDGEGVFKFYDVGQADCALFIFPDGTTLLIDGGDGRYTNTLKILQDFKRLGVSKLDYVILTAYADEHSSGLKDILSIIDCETVYYPYYKNNFISNGYKNFMQCISNVKNKYISQFGCNQKGVGWFFSFLSPSVMGNDINSTNLSEYEIFCKEPTLENRDNCSAVLYISCLETTAIYCSDVRTGVLMSIYDNYRMLGASHYTFNGCVADLRDCNLLKVPMHGHKRARCTSFYDMTYPEYSIFSTGENNADCPDLAVVSDAQNSGDVLVTMNTGDITININSEGYTLSKEKA